jgi:D-sedoheptulose 7-phosphate isomerase
MILIPSASPFIHGQPPQNHARAAIARSLQAAQSALSELIARPETDRFVHDIAITLAQAFHANRKVLIIGNGGSMADAMHFAEELTGRFRLNRPALPALACSDPTHLTCTANDFGFEHVFSRWVEAVGQPGDVLIALSTSGQSRNILLAVHAAKARGLVTATLLGKDGGMLQGLCDHQIFVPGEGSDRIQELHMLILHTLVEAIEIILFGQS